MNIFDNLAKNEKDMMMSYIRDYACEPCVSLEYLMREWNKSKEHLYHLFGDNFILERDIEIEESEGQIMSKISKDLLHKHCANDSDWEYDYTFIDEILKFANNNYNWRDGSSVKSNICVLIYELLSNAVLANNVYNGATVEITSFDNYVVEKPYKIQKGCKAIKALGKLANTLGLHGFEEFRIAHSMCLNHKKTYGHLCLSIHPLDFMTMSDNESDWTSCMSWSECGCYRQGTVEMMNSPIVVVAYLTAEKDMLMPNGDNWNNKKWRELFIVNDNIICNVKGYPYCNTDLEHTVINWLRDLKMQADKINYTEHITHYNPWEDCTFEDFEYPVYVDPCTNQMYNDFGHEFHYAIINTALEPNNHNNHSRIYHNAGPSDKVVINLSYSGFSECMCCGELDTYFTSEESLIGECCDGSIICDICDDAFDEDEIYCIDGEYLCGYCYENNTEEDIDGNVHLIRNMNKIYLASSDLTKRFNRYYIYIYDEYALEDFIGEEKLFTAMPTQLQYNYYSDEKYAIPFDKITDEGAKQFGFSNAEELKGFVISNINETWQTDDIAGRIKQLVN